MIAGILTLLYLGLYSGSVAVYFGLPRVSGPSTAVSPVIGKSMENFRLIFKLLPDVFVTVLLIGGRATKVAHAAPY
ncbi:MAG: hypothetical protein EPN21_04825 [Methylococcaceae bacterium]|nr:MAG: hypothetical protein EPN21_04825 [Methylococcaceae bacterium]